MRTTAGRRFDYVRRVPGSGWRRTADGPERALDTRRRGDWRAWGRVLGKECPVFVIGVTEAEAHRWIRAASSAYTTPVLDGSDDEHPKGSDLLVFAGTLGSGCAR
jgi:hypothetical protein